eukprot:scaffold55373_cov33-Tisochrysis_lutea.AAC.1
MDPSHDPALAHLRAFHMARPRGDYEYDESSLPSSAPPPPDPAPCSERELSQHRRQPLPHEPGRLSLILIVEASLQRHPAAIHKDKSERRTLSGSQACLGVPSKCGMEFEACLLALLAFLLFLGILLFPVLNPTIEAMGVDGSEPDHGAEISVEREACALAGSLNPPHMGHLAMLKYLRRRGYRRIHVVIGVNAKKKYAVSPKQRAELLRSMCSKEGLPDVEVHVVTGYIWRWAFQHGISKLFRGIRSWGKDGREERFLHLLNQVGPLALGLRWPIRTVFLQADPTFAHISSTLVREACERCRSPGDAKLSLAGLVPAGMETEIWGMYCPTENRAPGH